MNKKSETSFENFTEGIFKKTYGFSSTALYYSERQEERKNIQDAVSTLRKSYKTVNPDGACPVYYHDDSVRRAYMVAYYPYYCIPMYNVVKDAIIPALMQRESLSLDYFACGPCPELHGSALAFGESQICKNLDVHAYDAEQGWSPFLKNTTQSLCNEILPTDVTFNGNYLITANYGCPKTVENADVVFLQNYLSHLRNDENSVGDFWEWFTEAANSLKSGAFFVCVDLNGYKAAEIILNAMSNPNLMNELNLEVVSKRTPAVGGPLQIVHGQASFGIRKNIFDHTDNLIMKCKTNYYYVVLRKKQIDENFPF